MRLIDADALAVSDMAKIIDNYLSGQCNLTVGLAAELMPTIEAVPMQHGRWIAKLPYDDEVVKDLEFQIVCSKCDQQNSSINFSNNGEIIGKTFYKTKFCPNCGARMDVPDTNVYGKEGIENDT